MVHDLGETIKLVAHLGCVFGYDYRPGFCALDFGAFWGILEFSVTARQERKGAGVGL